MGRYLFTSQKTDIWHATRDWMVPVQEVNGGSIRWDSYFDFFMAALLSNEVRVGS